jgi:hypothetical protein
MGSLDWDSSLLQRLALPLQLQGISMGEAEPTDPSSEPTPGKEGMPIPDPDTSPFALPDVEEVERGLDPWRIEQPSPDD